MPNGESPNLKTSSTFLNHLTSYPLIHDALTTLSTHPLTATPINLTHEVYTRLYNPVAPYLQGPYSYAKPYVTRADELADNGLSRVEERFPIVKEETGTVVQSGKDLLWMPVRVAGEGKDYVVGTWNDEYNKTLSHSPTQKPTLQTSFLALLSTELKLASDFLQAVADVLAQQSRSQKAQHGADAPTTKVNGRLAERFSGAGEAAGGLADKVAKRDFHIGNSSSSNDVQAQAEDAGKRVQGQVEEAGKKGQGLLQAGKQKANEVAGQAQQKAQ